VTVVAIACGVHSALLAANLLTQKGIQAEAVDLRTVVPLDKATVPSLHIQLLPWNPFLQHYWC